MPPGSELEVDVTLDAIHAVGAKERRRGERRDSPCSLRPDGLLVVCLALA